MKILLSQCLNGTEIEAFNKIEDIASRLHDVICRIDQDEMKSMKQFIYLLSLKEVIGSSNDFSNVSFWLSIYKFIVACPVKLARHMNQSEFIVDVK